MNHWLSDYKVFLKSQSDLINLAVVLNFFADDFRLDFDNILRVDNGTEMNLFQSLCGISHWKHQKIFSVITRVLVVHLQRTKKWNHNRRTTMSDSFLCVKLWNLVTIECKKSSFFHVRSESVNVTIIVKKWRKCARQEKIFSFFTKALQRNESETNGNGVEVKR